MAEATALRKTILRHLAQGAPPSARQNSNQSSNQNLNLNLNPAATPQDLPLVKLLGAAETASRRQLTAYLKGVTRYQDQSLPPRASMPVLAEEGSTRLLDYASTTHRSSRTLLVIPSLINRAHILDLTPEASLLRYLATQGLRPVLVDWGAPGMAEKNYMLGDYLLRLRRLEQRLKEKWQLPKPPDLLGYCMGGLFALALTGSAVVKNSSRRLALLATPWDFHAGWPAFSRLAAGIKADLPKLWQPMPPVPGTLVQAVFSGQQPASMLEKFVALAKETDVAKLSLFASVEDWVNDPVPLAAGVAAECLSLFYAENRTARGTWAPLGMPITPETLPHTTLLVAPQQDRIVPRASALALAGRLPRASLLNPKAGHISAIVGSAARREVWEPLAAFFRA